MITLYLWDARGVYTHSLQADPAAAMPLRSTPTPQPNRQRGGFFMPREGLMENNETRVAAFKITLLTLAGAVAEVTLERWLTIAILIYTLAQLYFLIRDKWWRDPERFKEKEGAQNDAQ